MTPQAANIPLFQFCSPRIRLRHSSFNSPYGPVLRKRTLKFEECRCLAFHDPNMDVRGLLTYEWSDRPRNPFDLCLDPIVLGPMREDPDFNFLFRSRAEC